METQTKFDFDKVLEAFKPFDDLLNKYFNTTDLKGAELKEHQMRVGSQNWLILDFFKSQRGILFTPFQVQKYLGLVHTPITSIRRAMTTLTDLKYLVKTDTMRSGEYGELCHTWKYNC
jgi:hypothetical protein